MGAGGMGEVYLAHDTILDRKVAIKFLNAEFGNDPDKLNRFIHEAKATSALNHPNILTVYEIGQAEGRHYIVSELIEGETLRGHLTQHNALSLNQILKIVVQVGEALAAAHQAGIIHRDIKPENVMIRPDGYAKVLDFGIAKLTERPSSEFVDKEAQTQVRFNTSAGVVMGTLIYMSPEQARGLLLDARTDIFSFGVLMYELVAGRRPFDGLNQNDLLAALFSDKEPAPMASYSSEVPGELERIVAKALRKERDERYQTVKDLLLDLKSLQQNLEFEKKLERSAQRIAPAETNLTRERHRIARLGPFSSHPLILGIFL